jgi:hypothetical protein
MMFKIGDKVKISNSYNSYKSMRGLSGKVIWIGILGGDPCCQIQTDFTPPRLGRNTCFVLERELSSLSQPKKEGE